VALYPCSMCGQRRPGKLASAYWAWFRADGERTAWKQRVCAPCLIERIAPLVRKYAETNGENCPACGTTSTDDLDQVYLTLYVPSHEPVECAFATDAACAARIRVDAQLGATKLADRGASVRGPSPTPTAEWDAIGLAPV
jgi:hypothetical protein